MAPFHEIEKTPLKTIIGERRLYRRRVYPGRPTVVAVLDDKKLKISEDGRERIVEVDGSKSPQTVFTSNQYGKIHSIEWREK